MNDAVSAPPHDSSPFGNEAKHDHPAPDAFRDQRIADLDGNPRAIEDDSVVVYLAGFGGTVLAGALFPIAMTLAFAVVERQTLHITEVALTVVAGFPIGGFYAGAAALCVFPVVALVQALAGLSRYRAVMASIAGGWSVVAATQWLDGQDALGQGSLDLQLLTLVAIIMGQVGAGWSARMVRRRQSAAARPRAADVPPRFTLRQLLGLTTGVAVVAAILSTLRIPPRAYQAILETLLLQGCGVSLYFVIAKSRRFT